MTSLVSSGVNGRDIAVIAPYNLQVSGRGGRGGGEGRGGDEDDMSRSR